MTPNKVQHFQEWLSGFKKKPIVIKSSSLPTVEDYENERLSTQAIYGREAGEKLRNSLIKLHNAQNLKEL